ncbi:MAG TPA: DNA-processing protein DprA [Candidatus Limnocylindrales bacterium]|nr:DNA-processing protein DprA [Candidatus Limnocylindrales bacterium]
MEDVEESVLEARLGLSWVREPGSKALYTLVQQMGPVDAWRSLTTDRAMGNLRQAAASRLRGRDPARIVAELRRAAHRLGVTIVVPESPQWPSGLDDLAAISVDGIEPIERDTFPPHALWLRGPLPLEVTGRSIAIVGSRASTDYGEHVASELAYRLARGGWTVVSGGAYGIDAAAHRGAISAGGNTIATLASGVDHPYPTGNSHMFDEIAEAGLLISEWPPGSAPHRVRFLIRNRVIAALTRGTVMVEASARSGARQTLRRARQLGRVAMAVPGPVTSMMSIGSHEELRREGDERVRLVASADHVLEEVGAIGDGLTAVPQGPVRPFDLLSTLEKQIIDATPHGSGATAEQIAANVGLPVTYVLATLPSLEMRGHVKRGQDGAYRLALKT